MEFDQTIFQAETSRICRIDRPRWWIVGTEGGFVKTGRPSGRRPPRAGHRPGPEPETRSGRSPESGRRRRGRRVANAVHPRSLGQLLREYRRPSGSWRATRGHRRAGARGGEGARGRGAVVAQPHRCGRPLGKLSRLGRQDLLMHPIRPADVLAERKQPDRIDHRLPAIAIWPRITRTFHHVGSPVGSAVRAVPGRGLSPDLQSVQQRLRLLPLRRVDHVIGIKPEGVITPGAAQSQRSWPRQSRRPRKNQSSVRQTPWQSPAAGPGPLPEKFLSH